MVGEVGVRGDPFPALGGPNSTKDGCDCGEEDEAEATVQSERDASYVVGSCIDGERLSGFNFPPWECVDMIDLDGNTSRKQRS